MTSYADQFTQAVANTRAAGISCPELTIDRSRTRYFQSAKQWTDMLRKALLHETAKPIEVVAKKANYFRMPSSRVDQCCVIHAFSQEGIQQALGAKACLTVGYVVLPDGTAKFEVSFAEILKLLSAAAPANTVARTVALHTWLTFDSGEILDFTICPTLHARGDTRFGENGVVASYPEFAPNLVYHPVAAGRDLLLDLKVFSFS